jgi:hypothetical protein
MGLFDLDRTPLGTDPTALAVFIVKPHHFAVVHKYGRIGTNYPTGQALSALL